MSKKSKLIDLEEGELIGADVDTSGPIIDIELGEKLRKNPPLSDEAKKSSCNLEAYGIVYDKQGKRYEIVTIKYSYDKQYAVFEKVELTSDHQLLALEALTSKIDLNKVRSQGKGE